MWGGVDVWKEQMIVVCNVFLVVGVVIIVMDNVGIGELLVKGVQDVECQFLFVFEWVVWQVDLDVYKVGILGCFFGGYWVIKLVYLYFECIVVVVNWGGGVYYMF